MGPGHSWVSYLWFLAEMEEDHLCSTDPGGSHGTGGLQRPRWKIRKGGEGWGERELEKEQSSGNNLFRLSLQLLVSLVHWTVI